MSVDGSHGESLNNLGVLELRKGNIDLARAGFQAAAAAGSFLFEPSFNGALLAYKLGDFQEAFSLASRSAAIYPEHADTRELLKQLRAHFSVL